MAGSWVGSITKWAFSSSRGPSRESSPPLEEDPADLAQAAADKLATKAAKAGDADGMCARQMKPT